MRRILITLIIVLVLLAEIGICRIHRKKGRHRFSESKLRHKEPSYSTRIHRAKFEPYRPDWRPWTTARSDLFGKAFDRFWTKDRFRPIFETRPPPWRHFSPWRRHSFGAGFGNGDWFDIDFKVDFFSNREAEWWKGDNVCTSTEKSTVSISKFLKLFGSFDIFSRICTDEDGIYKCVTTETHDGSKKTTTDIFKCCHGYKRRDTMNGCIMEFTFDDLVETAGTLNLTQYVRIVKSVGLENELLQRNLTLFVPNDDAIILRMKDIASMASSLNSRETPIMVGNTLVVNKESTELVVNDTRALLRCNMVQGIQTTGYWDQDQLLTTECPLSEGNTIRINFFNNPKKVITANCIKITTPDHMASNGVIHVTDKFIHSPTKSLMELVSEDPNLRILTSILRSTGVGRRLDGNTSCTLFAPTDDAFMKLKPRFAETLIGSGICLKGLLEGLLHSKVICSSIIEDTPVFTTNMQSETMTLERKKDGKLLIERIRINKTDIMATNGVLHVVENLYIPSYVKGVTEKLQGLRVTKALKLFTEAGLSKLLTDSKDLTVFLPSDDALKDLPADVKIGWQANPKDLQNILKYHIVKNEKQRAAYKSDKVLKTLYNNETIMMQEIESDYSVRSTVQCKPIVERNIKACNINFSIIDKVLIPPKGNVIDILTQDGRVSMFLDIIREAGFADRLQERGPFTIVAPTNEVVMKIKEMGKRDRRNYRNVYKKWIIKGHMCCSEIMQRHWPYGMSFDADLFSHEYQVTCDQMATNGVVHISNNLEIMPYAHYKNPLYTYL